MKKRKSQVHPLEGASCGTLINVNGQIHLIGGWENSKHLVWNDETSCFSQIYDFKQQLDDVINLSLVYIHSKRIIIMIAGCDADDYDNKNIVWRHSIETKKWKKITKLPFCHETRSPVLTSDEKYIIMSDGLEDHIYALDISNGDDTMYPLYQSTLKGPFNEAHFLMKTGGLRDEILVMGWIKKRFRAYKGMPLPPKHLMVLIAIWYSQEEIHWIGKYSKLHFAVNVKHILSSLHEIS